MATLGDTTLRKTQATISWSDPAIIYEAHRAMPSLDLFRAMQPGELPMEPAMALLGAEVESVEPGEVGQTARSFARAANGCC